VTGQGGRVVHYCPCCQRAVEPLSIVCQVELQRTGQLNGCPNCYTPTQAWPADLPLPTLANVRAMWGALNNLRAPLPRGRFLPRNNGKGVWN